MSEGKRAWNLVRGYAGQLSKEWDRVSHIALSSAERELESSLNGPEQRTESAEQTVVTPPRPAPSMSPAEKIAQARTIIGVTESATFSEIRKVYEALLKRCDPAHFTAGSAEANQAMTIRKRVEWAYTVLSEQIGSAEKRFGSLEID